MSDAPTFLETEAAMAALLDELEKMRSASEQLDQAGLVAQQLTDASQKMAHWAGQVLERGSRQLETTERISGEVSHHLERFDQGQSELAKGVQVIERSQGDTVNRLEEVQRQQAILQNSHSELKVELNEKIQQQQSRLEVLSADLKGELDEFKARQETVLQAQSDLIRQAEEKVMANLASLEQYAGKSARAVNILLIISALNAVLVIVLLALRMSGR
jgi:hypothetical protein